jgi:hypothetical protein
MLVYQRENLKPMKIGHEIPTIIAIDWFIFNQWCFPIFEWHKVSRKRSWPMWRNQRLRVRALHCGLGNVEPKLRNFVRLQMLVPWWNTQIHGGFSKKGGHPSSWMVDNGKSYRHGWFVFFRPFCLLRPRGNPHCRNPPNKSMCKV